MTSRRVLGPSNIIPGFFTEGNVKAVSIIVSNILTKEFNHDILIPTDAVESMMDTVYEESVYAPTFRNVNGQYDRGLLYLNNIVMTRLLSSCRQEILTTQRATNWLKNERKARMNDSSLGLRNHDIIKLRLPEKTLPLVWSRSY
uniref:Uncharacterized protein n=1 Tax=viral metagenome TaxID=1070528 RepID=A0A6C0LXX6_9ZZZZ